MSVHLRFATLAELGLQLSGFRLFVEKEKWSRQFWNYYPRSSPLFHLFLSLVKRFSSLHLSGLQPNAARMREADAEPKNVMTEVHTKELSQQSGESDTEEDPEEDQENGLYEEIYEDTEDEMNEEPEEALEVEIYGESDEDPANTIVEVSEDDPEEEINDENDCDIEEEVYEESDENPEEEMDEEPEQESEEEVIEDLEDGPEEIDEEPEEESQEEIVEDLEDGPEEIDEEPEEESQEEIVEDLEDDAEEEINEENGCDLEDKVYEDPEGEMDEEPEEESEEEVVLVEDDPVEEMDEEPEEELEEETVEDLEDDPEEESDEEQAVENSSHSPLWVGSADAKDLGLKLNGGADGESGNKMVAIKNIEPISSIVTPAELHQSDNATKHVDHSSRLRRMTPEDCRSQKIIQNEEKFKSKSDGALATREFDSKIGPLSVAAHDDCASKQQEPGTRSRKHRHSRWDLRAEEETPLIAETSKRRKTRWNNDDSGNFLLQVSSSLELSTDPEVLRLKERLMEMNKMLQSSENNGKETAEEISPPKPDNNNHGMKINARARRKLEKRQRKILSQLATLLSGKSPYPYTKKIFVPVGEYQTYKFIGHILEPKGNTLKRMEKETGARIRLRGKGSGESSEAEESHIFMEAANQRALNTAVAMVEKLLIPVANENNERQKAQLAELAKIRGTYKDQNKCQLCKEQGHRQYACPLKDSSFNGACCDTCGSFDHPTSECISTEKSMKEGDSLTLYVGYLSQVTDEKRLKELFLPFGKIIKATVIKDPVTGLSKGYGFVEFDNSTDASAAVKYMNGYKMAGKVLAVRIAGQKPVPAPSATSVPSVIYGQATSIYDPEPSIFPGAQFSIAGSKSLYFPHSSGSVARPMGLTIPPYAATSTIYPRRNDNDFSSREFSCQIASSFPNSAISQFSGNPGTGSQLNPYITRSQFNPYLTNPVMDEYQTIFQITKTEEKSTFGPFS